MEPRYDEESFPPERRPVIRTINAFAAALADGQIPARIATAVGADYVTSQAVISIPKDDEDFRRAVAAVLPAGTYRIEVRRVYGRISGAPTGQNSSVTDL